MADVNVTIRMDESLKQQADSLFADLGMTLSGAVNIFIKQSVREQSIPFRIGYKAPNRETLEAIEEVRQLKNNPNKKTYHSFDEVLKELDDEV